MLLLWLIVLPLIGAIISWQSERFNKSIPQYSALFITCLIFILSLFLRFKYTNLLINSTTSIKWKIYFFIPWIKTLGINIILAIDDLSLLMIILTTFMSIISIINSWNEKFSNSGTYYCHLLCIISSTIGIFISVDLFVFFIFWEMMLIPMYFLITNWGHQNSNNHNHIHTAIKFLIYTQISSVIMLISIITLVLIHYQSTNILTFAYNELLNTKMSDITQYILMIGFFIAFAIKIPLVPFHGWIPDVQEYLPTTGSIDIIGIIIKTGIYGILHFIIPFFPKASIQFTPIIIIIGIITIFYGTLLAFKQTDIKRLIAYSSLSHMGFIIIGIYANSKFAYQGVILQLITNSLSTTALIIISSHIYKRLKTRDMRIMGGLWQRIQWLPGFSLFFVIANFNLPGTGNFIAEFLILYGIFEKFELIAIIMLLGLIFTSIYSLWMIQQIYFGQPKTQNKLNNLNYYEIIVLFTLAILLTIIGIYPNIILNISHNIINSLYKNYLIHF